MMAAKRDGRSVMRLERMFRSEIDEKLVHHVAGGPHKGILIAKALDSELDKLTTYTFNVFYLPNREGVFWGVF